MDQQHLRIKAFYGTSDNAVKTQIWIAVCVYLTTLIAHKRLALEIDHHTMMQILSVSIFEKTPAKTLFSRDRSEIVEGENHKQLELFNL